MKTEREMFVKKYREVFKVDKSLFVNDSGEFIDEFCQSVYEIWQARVPEGYVVVPVNTLKRTIGHISTAMCHPMNKKEEEDIMQIDMDIIEKAMLEAVEK